MGQLVIALIKIRCNAYSGSYVIVYFINDEVQRVWSQSGGIHHGYAASFRLRELYLCSLKIIISSFRLYENNIFYVLRKLHGTVYKLKEIQRDLL